MEISRRKFLKYGLATVAAGGMAGIAVSPLVKKLFQEEEQKNQKEANKEPINFYVSLNPNTQYSQESFDLAREYFREKVGIDVNFVYCDKDKIPKLDHLNNFALVSCF